MYKVFEPHGFSEFSDAKRIFGSGCWLTYPKADNKWKRIWGGWKLAYKPTQRRRHKTA